MCGICGIYAYAGGSRPVEVDELVRIRDAMTERGPDGRGQWISNDRRVVLGHRRLSIIDLSDAAAQPMTSADGRVAITFNGEIYNYKSLRQELEAEGHSFRTQSDTEVLLQLYAAKGERMVDHLRGMFAFCLWDANREALLLARDPYGIKPLYYANDGSTLRIASQVKALIASGSVSKSPEPAGWVGFLLFGSVPEPHTIYRDVRAVPAGSLLWIDSSGVREPRRYFSIADTYCRAESATLELADEKIQAEVRDALVDSVRHHLVSDVPVGAFLSAGVDSGALVGLMRDAGQRDIQTITLTFDEFLNTRDDEAPIAKEIATLYGTHHTSRVVTEQEFHDDLPRILLAMDQPTVDGINTWFVSKGAKELGLKVAISGLGGDELFGGYSSFRDIRRCVQMMALPSRIPFLGDAFRTVASTFSGVYSGVSPKSAGLIKFGGHYRGAYFLRRALFMPWELENILGADMAREGLKRLCFEEWDSDAADIGPKTIFAKVATLEASNYMRNQLLRDTDWASMAHSVEVRVPLVDAALLARIAPLMVGLNRPDGKHLLGRSPSTPLPDTLIRRPKSGFGTPVGKWLRKKTLPNVSPGLLATRNRDRWTRHWACEMVSPLTQSHPL
jgi:asparagine synthase (glutamine-hydrolysing)